MNRRAPIAIAALAASSSILVAAPGLAGGPQRVAAAAKPGQHSVELLKCSSGKQAAKRWALFRGEMKQIAEGTGMRMRFELSEKLGADPWRAVHAPGLGEWLDASAGISRFAYRQKVAGLKPATRYRVVVTFQWLDGSGHVAAEAASKSRTCRQRGKLPNLAIRDAVKVREGPTPDTYRYAVRIGNDGKAPSGRSELVLRIDGAEVDSRPIGRLKAGARRTVRFVGPACQSQVAAQIDPKDVVRETTEQDNARTGGCTLSQ
jgi:hypothetical protein